jgi:hypothetical protein
MAESQGIFTLYSGDEFLNYLEHTSFGRSVRLIQNHHTYSPSYKSFKNTTESAFALLNGMRNFHMHTNGWSNIGQNITTFPDGTIALCRPINDIPSCIKGANTYGIGIEHLGNFGTEKDKPENIDVMTPAHKDAIVFLNAALCKKFSLTPNTESIVYHHWYDLNTGKRTNGTGVTKTCPGTTFFGGNTVQDAEKNFIPLIKQKLESLKANATPQPEEKKGIVTANFLNVRDVAGLNGKVLRQLTQGTPVSIFFETNGWYKISSANSEWINSKFVTLQ